MAEHRNAQDLVEEVLMTQGDVCKTVTNRVGKEVRKEHAPTSKKIKTNRPL